MEDLRQKNEGTTVKIDELGKKLDLLMEKLLPAQDEILESAPGDPTHGTGSSSRSKFGEPAEVGMRTQGSNFSSRVEYPYFDRVDPCIWLRKCERYFRFHHIVDPQQKLESVVLHINGKAEAWFFSYHISKGNVKWNEFTEEICKRFDNASNSKFNLVGEFKKIEQKGTVNEYLEKFEELKAWVLINSSLSFLLKG